MPKAVLHAYSNPASPEAEAQFNTWYDEVHLKEVLAIPGVRSATRYRLAEVNPFSPEHRYLAVYELDIEPAAMLAELGSGRLSTTDTIDTAGARMAFWVSADDNLSG
jgi:hypothetical protein